MFHNLRRSSIAYRAGNPSYPAGSLWVTGYIAGQDFGWPTFSTPTTAGVSLWAELGSPTDPQNFLIFLEGSPETDRNRAYEAIGDNLFGRVYAVLTSYDAEAGFHASARVRLHIKPGMAVRGEGGGGGKGGCVAGAGKVNKEHMGGGGGGCGARWFHLADPGVRIGGRGGLNSCDIPGGPHGSSGEREVNGLGNDAVLSGGPNVDTDGSAGDPGLTALYLNEDLEVVNEGKIYGGGGGGGGAWSNGFGNGTYPGDGGFPGEPGEASRVRAGVDQTFYAGGAAGNAVDRNGHTITWFKPDGSAGSPGDVKGPVA